jgi:hypothetical protein
MGVIMETQWIKYKALARIDPRLLDVNHLFQGSAQPQAKVIFLCSMDVGVTIDMYVFLLSFDLIGW